MRVAAGGVRVRGSTQFRSGWLQAGFSSLAYRLAHLPAPRPVTVLTVGLLFFLV
jgi:hypothetical protein